MAHGWNSYYQNLPSMSADPGALGRSPDTEGTFSNFIGQEFSNPVALHEGHINTSTYCTNYYPNTGITNSSSDCIYQRYNGETPWQADGQTGKGYLQRCAKSNIPDFATDRFQTSQLQDLGLNQECGTSAASFLESYSDVSSGSDETKPSCNYVASNVLPRPKIDLPPENASPDWISSHTGSMNVPIARPVMRETDAIVQSRANAICPQDEMDSPENLVESSAGNDDSIATSDMTTTKFDTVHVQNDDRKHEKKTTEFTQTNCSDISRSGHGNMIGDEIPAPAGNDAEMTITAATIPTDNEKDFFNQNVTEKKLDSENQEFQHRNNMTDKNLSEEEKVKSEVLVNEKSVLDFLKREVSDMGHESVGSLSEDTLSSRICVTDVNLCQQECNVAEKTKDSLSPNSGNTCESVSEGIPASEDQALFSCVDSSPQLHKSNTNASLHSGNEQSVEEPVEEQKTSETVKTNSSEPSFTNDSPAKCRASIDIGQEVEMTVSSEQNTTTSTAHQNCISSENNEQKVGLLSDSCLQPVLPDANETVILTAPEKLSTTSLAEPDDATSGTNDSIPSTSTSLETCSQLNSSSRDAHSCSKMEWTEGETASAHSLIDQDLPSKKTDANETLCPYEGIAENAQESFEDMDVSTENPSVSDTLYGEPLSREDSSCDPDEPELDSSRHIDVDRCGTSGNFDSKEQEPQLKFSAQMEKVLHPVVILTRMESSTGPSEFYHCAKCDHTSSNVDSLLAHHHCSHAMVDVQLCKTCNLYQIRNEEPTKHECDGIHKHIPDSPDEVKLTNETKHGRHKCNRCGKGFSRIFPYIQHMRAHTGKTPFRCDGCGSYFSQSCALTRHKKFPGRCKRAKRLNSRPDLVRKKNQIPPLENGVENDKYANIQECYVKLVDISKTNVCYICGKHYTSVAKANKHRYAVHSIRSVSILLKHFVPKVESTVNKKHKCPLCPRLFKYSYNRARHLRDCVRDTIYGGKRKVNGLYQCPLCCASFSLPHNRYRHIKNSCMRDTLNRLAQENGEPIQPKMDKEQKILRQAGQQKAQPEGSERKKLILPNSTAKPEPRYKCGICPAVFYHPSSKYKHKKKHELYKLSGKMIKYRKSVSSAMAKPTIPNNTKPDENKESLKLTEENTSAALECHFCGKCFCSPNSLKQHKLKHRGERPYHCLECGKRFKRRSHLVNHKIIHQKRIQCTVCRKILPTIGELIRHRSLHPKRGLLKCPECPQEFQYPAFLLRHLPVHQNKEKKGSQVDETPSSKPQQSLDLPEQTKSNLLHCSLCNEKFDDPQSLRKHCLTHISRSSSNQCPFCERRFACRQYLLRHMLIHTGKRPFSCSKCGKQFYRLMFLKLHSQKCLSPTEQLLTTQLVTPVPIKKKNPYLCSFCPRSFSKKIRLKNHHSAHKRNALQLCTNCDQYYGYTKMNQHLNECKGTTKNNDSSSLSPVKSSIKCTLQTEKAVEKAPLRSNTSKLLPLKCPHCPKRFRFKSVQLRHLVTHTGVQPYACMHCDQRFGSQNMCLQHEAFCDGICKGGLLKPTSDVKKQPDMPPVEKTAQADNEAKYKCRFCTKTFMKARSLRCHILTHNEVKPYRCKACDGCFSRYDHLKVHQARCKGRKRRLEVCIPKISLDDVGKGWQLRFANEPSEKKDSFDCEDCSRSFPSQSRLAQHNTLFHTVRLFKCSRCGSVFSHEKSLKKHRRTNKCKRLFIHESNVPPDGTSPVAENVMEQHGRLSRVLKRIQPSLNKRHKYGCSYCPRVFSNNSHLGVHIRLHTGEKPYSCNYCRQKFVRKDYLKRHFLKCTMKEQESSVLCDRCGSFFPASKLENHKKGCTSSGSPASLTKRTRHSTAESPPKGFSCAYCSSRFLLFSQLQEHFLALHTLEMMEPPVSTAPLQQHLSNMPNSEKETADESCVEGLSDDTGRNGEQSSSLEKEVPKKFYCSDCEISFASKAGLMGHLRSHQEGNPFKCKICDKGFANKTLLRNHYRKCRKNKFMTKQESPLKATLDFAVNDSVLGSTETSETSGDLQTISCKDNFSDESSQESEESQEHSSSCKEKKEVQYQCSECDKTFTDGLMLISHLEDHGRREQEKKRNTCTRCGRVCSNQANLEKHMMMHGINKTYSCLKCSKTFFTQTDLEDHKTCHDPNRPYHCKLCHQRFLTRPALCNHYSEEHRDAAFTCKICSKTYASKRSLSRHYKKWHQNEKRDCDRMGHEKGDDQQKLNSKVSTSDESDKDENTDGQDSDSDFAPYFPCHVCGKTFTTSENLEDHQLCHLGEKPHECAECGKCFFQASQLQQHQRMHQSEFQCPTCGKGFVSLFALRKHKQNHGKIHPYRCSKCQLSFKCQSQLSEHMYTHREDNFPCDICNQVFVSKSSRAEHRKSHSIFHDQPPPPVSRAEQEQPSQMSESSVGYTTEFKYRCGVCHERFRDPEELSEHGCIAAIERQYSCTDCDQHFLHASHLKKHRTNHHPPRSDSEYPCNQCKTTFYSTKDFLNHLNCHDDIVVEIKRESDDEGEGPIPTFICPVCHQCFPSGIDLIYHFPTHPDGAYKCEKVISTEKKVEEGGGACQTPAVSVITCQDCGQRFSGGDALHQHKCSHEKQTVMENSSKQSSQTFYREYEEEEVDVTGVELYSCPTCSKRFVSKSKLLEHQTTDHSDGKPFNCEICGKSFARRRYLTRHKHIHKKNVNVSDTPPPPKGGFNCFRCNANFSTKQDFSEHMRLHAEKEVGQFRCDMCYKSFNQGSLLRQHQESHVGQVVYECTECEKAFAFPHLLEKHQKTHAGSSR